MLRGRSTRNTSTSTTCLPVPTSKASARSDTTRCRASALSVALVSHTRPDEMTGDDQPAPGTAAFQTTLRDSLQSSGRPWSAAWPCASGPRNSGHCAAAVAVTRNDKRAKIGTATIRCQKCQECQEEWRDPENAGIAGIAGSND